MMDRCRRDTRPLWRNIPAVLTCGAAVRPRGCLSLARIFCYTKDGVIVTETPMHFMTAAIAESLAGKTRGLLSLVSISTATGSSVMLVYGNEAARASRALTLSIPPSLRCGEEQGFPCGERSEKA